MTRSVLLALGLALVVACRDEPMGVAPASDLATDRDDDNFGDRGRGFLGVMTRNLYIGADVDRIIEAAVNDPPSVPVAVATAFQTFVETDFEGTRAKLLAREIARTRPHLVGLQEVSRIVRQSPGDFFVDPRPDETNNVLVVEFLEILLDELRARGLDYREVATIRNTDVELPMATLTGLDDVRVTDFDVILARADVAVDPASVTERNYSVSINAGGLEILRGFVGVDARVADRTVRFVNTHLESGAEPVRRAQAEELIAELETEILPLVLVGDFNSDAHTASPTYRFIVGQGYADLWLHRAGRTDPGFTCCHLPDLSNERSLFDKRIDLIFVRNLPERRGGRFSLRPVFATVVGDSPRERRNGLWASDHGGVVAVLHLLKRKGHERHDRDDDLVASR